MSLAGRSTTIDVRERTQLLLRELPLILLYHHVGYVTDDPFFLSVRPERFEEQMRWLERRGLRGVGVGELVDAMREGRQRGLVGITFDDGYADVATHALPILGQLGFTASVYVVADQLGGTNDWDANAPSWPLLDADGVRAFVSAGMEVGSHGATHRDVRALGDDELDVELVSSRRALAALSATEVRGFAYPYGAMDARSRDAVRLAGYEYALAVEAPRSARGRLALPRTFVGQMDHRARFELKRRVFRLDIARKGKRK